MCLHNHQYNGNRFASCFLHGLVYWLYTCICSYCSKDVCTPGLCALYYYYRINKITLPGKLRLSCE